MICRQKRISGSCSNAKRIGWIAISIYVLLFWPSVHAGASELADFQAPQVAKLTSDDVPDKVTSDIQYPCPAIML